MGGMSTPRRSGATPSASSGASRGRRRVDPGMKGTPQMSNSDDTRDTDAEQYGLTRADLLKTAAAGAGVLIGAGAPAAGAEAWAKRAPAGREVAGMNVLVFLTDQQRAVQHFPP